jgi:Na+-driven multidrug efflux pump
MGSESVVCGDGAGPSSVRLFSRYLLSSLLGLLAITTATLVDGFFVGRFVGGEALAAITLLIPFFTFLFSLALMLGIGGSVRCGFHLGQRQAQAASVIFSCTLLLTFVVAVTVVAVAVWQRTQLLTWLGADAALYRLMNEYFLYLAPGLIIQALIMVLYYFVRADDHPQLATRCLLAGALLNILLDALLVGMLNGGMRGAAVATVLAQLGQGALLCRYFRSSARHLRLVWPDRRWREMRLVLINGLSEFVNEMSAGVVLLLINLLVMQQAGIIGIAGYSLINYVIFVSIMLGYGVADALHPLVSRHYGAGEVQRIRQLLWLAFGVVQVAGWLLVAVLLLAGEYWVRLMLGDAGLEVLPAVKGMLAVIWPLFLMNSTNVVLSCYLTAIQRPLPSLLLSMCRGLLLPLLLLSAVFYWLPQQPVVLALPLAELLALILAVALFWRHKPSQLAAHAERRT